MPKIKYTPKFLTQVEKLYAQSDFLLRYEKGNFKSGYCILQDKKVVVVNKYFTLDGKINCLIELLKHISIDRSKLNEEEKKLYLELINNKTLEIEF